MDEKYETVKLCYTIHKYSSYTPNYIPENIMVNNPSDQLSKWFTDCTTPFQYIILKLKSPSIVETIKFGKYIKTQVTDLKKFQIYGGTDENNLSLLLASGLKKDSNPETFRLRHRTAEGSLLPVRYIKIVPLQSWGPAYNYSIWYVELQGKNHEGLINSAMDTINMRKEEEAVRLILKHLRRRRYKDAFEALSRESGVQLEGPLQARLWNALVENGDYKLAEQILEEAVNEGEFDWYMSWQPYSPVWRLMSACSSQVEERLCCGDPAPTPTQPRTADLLCADRDPAEPLLPPAESLESCDANCNGASSRCTKPGPRGGHQLVVDATTGTLYLFGGWNGTEDLDDLWSFDPDSERWTLLCAHSKEAGGPAPRSCHKMVFDPVHRRLYTLGRYLDNAQRIPKDMNSDLYMYDIPLGEWSLLCADTAAVGGPRLVFDHQMCIDPDTQTIYVFGGRVLPANTFISKVSDDIPLGEWSLLCADTAAAGGPRLVFDHQMCIDPDTQTIYVFGGRVLPANTDEAASPVYSGLYAYYIEGRSWQCLLEDNYSGPAPAPLPRVSHSMLFHPVQRRLYIFAGQRNKEHLADLWWWDVGTGQRCAVCCASSDTRAAPPAAGFTQRATLDPDTDEMFVLSGMSKEKDKRVYNTLWVFSLRRLTWTCVYRNESVSPLEPRPRFAHQLVLDPVRKIHYLFGGNPGNQSSPRLRLDDLWSLQLTRPSLQSVWLSARAQLREACYRSLCATSPAAALRYLRQDLHTATDHSHPEQVARFHKLATVLFSGSEGRGEEGGAGLVGLTPRRTRALQRRRATHHVHADVAHALHAVLGADDNIPEPPQPFEEITAPTPDTWDVGDDADDEPEDPHQWEERAARIQLFESLSQYFRPSVVPPAPDVTSLVSL